MLDGSFAHTISSLLLMTLFGLFLVVALPIGILAYRLLGRPSAYARWMAFRGKTRWCGYKWAVPVAAVHFFICFSLQGLCFNKINQDNFTRAFFCNLLFFVLLQLFWQIIFYAYWKLRERDAFVSRMCLYGGICFAAFFILLLLIWPGYFEIDEWFIIQRSQDWNILGAYHFLIYLEAILGMMLVPSMAGIEILQSILIASVVG